MSLFQILMYVCRRYRWWISCWTVV